MADCNDPEILEAYEEVRDDKNATNWLLLQYASDKSDTLILKSKGTEGLKEFVDTLDENQAAFGYVRLNVSNDELSVRTKFVFVTWIGSGVKVMRKAKLSVHVSDVKRIIRAFAIDINAHDKSEFDEEEILVKLRRAGGANYDRGSHDY